MSAEFQELVGKKIIQVFMDSRYLQFATINRFDHQERFAYTVEGDCCSSSYFYDFLGVQNLLRNGKVVSIKDIQMNDTDLSDAYEVTTCYGYEIVTEHPIYGDMTSVFSFRNDSNGYYGGWAEKCDWKEGIPEITDDVLGTDQ